MKERALPLDSVGRDFCCNTVGGIFMSENMNRNLPDNIDIMGMSSELTTGASAILQNAKTDLEPIPK